MALCEPLHIGVKGHGFALQNRRTPPRHGRLIDVVDGFLQELDGRRHLLGRRLLVEAEGSDRFLPCLFQLGFGDVVLLIPRQKGRQVLALLRDLALEPLPFEQSGFDERSDFTGVIEQLGEGASFASLPGRRGDAPSCARSSCSLWR